MVHGTWIMEHLEELREQRQVERETLGQVGPEAPLEPELVGINTWEGGVGGGGDSGVGGGGSGGGGGGGAG